MTGSREKRKGKSGFVNPSINAPLNSIERTNEPMREMSETFLGANKARRDRRFSLWQLIKDVFSLKTGF